MVVTLNEFHLSSNPPHPWLGRLIGEQDRYRLDDPLGTGGMGDVFLATDMRLGKPVALKLLRESLAIAHDLDLKERFERECSICAALKSQHIVQVSDYGVTSEGYPFYVMEYLQGQTLGQLMDSQPKLSVSQACNLMTQVCAGLQLAHQGVELWSGSGNRERIKVVHRDLKPANIFLVPTALGDLVKIIDFGIAKIRSLQAEYDSGTSVFMGTCHYAAPEQFNIHSDVDERADIYSLGVMLYEMLTGVDPFGFDFRQQRVSNDRWLTAHAKKAPLPLRSHDPQLSPELEAIVMRCLEKSPDNRFASVQDLRAVLAEVQPDQSRVELPVSTRGSAVSIPSRSENRSRWVLLGGFLIVGAIATFTIPKLPNLISTSSIINPSQLTVKQDLKTNSPILTLAVSPDGKTFLSGSEQGTIEQRNVTPGASLTLAENLGNVRSLALTQDMLAAGSTKNTIDVWRLQTPGSPQTLTGHTAAVTAVALSVDGQTLVSGSEDRTIRVWDMRSGNSRPLQGHANTVYAVALSPDGKTIASGSADKTVRFWDLATGTLIRTLSEPGGHRDAVQAIAYSPDGQMLASASWDKSVKVWNAQTGALLHSLEGHGDRVDAVTFSVDGKTVVTASLDKTIKLWDAQSGKLLRTLTGHTDGVLALGVTPKGQIISSGRDETIKIWQ
jgi:eukaryotic-like serine/threonine-protein kinase